MYLSVTRLRFRGRRAAVAAAAGVVAIAAAGCSSFVSPPTAGQVAPNGDVAVNSVICVDGFGANDQGSGSGSFATSCAADAPIASGSGFVAGSQGQLLLAYLVPVGSTAPGALTSPDLSGVTFTQNADYVTWLDGDMTPSAGYAWVGYMSSEFSVAQATQVTVSADFAPPATTDGSLYSGPFSVQQVFVGDRADGSYIGSTLDPARTLDCDETVPSGIGPVPAYPSGCDDDQLAAPLNVTTRELTSTAPSSTISVQAGSTATVPFTVQYAGPSADPFALSASTSSNALVATPANATFTPSGSGNTVENVSVPVPAGLAPGSYTLTLNVGSFGSTAATLDVTAPPVTTTTTTTTVTPQQTAAVRPSITGLNVSSSSLKLTLRLSIAASERLTLQRLRAHRWITLKKLSTRGSAGLNTLHLRGLFGSLLTPAGRYRVTVQAFDGTVSSVAQTLSFTVR
jgi:hypothetical protein